MTQTAWQRRVRRFLFFAGTASTAWLFLSYVANRMREARVRALKERRERETIKAHFTSLLSTISFTLYALLPTLEPQLFAAYPVEATSQALQSKSSRSGTESGGTTTTTNTTEPTPGSTPADSMLLAPPTLPHPPSGPSDNASHAPLPSASISVIPDAPETSPASITDTAPYSLTDSLASVTSVSVSVSESDTSASSNDAGAGQVGESWASEFSARTHDDDMLTASTISQSISLPPTDTSSAAPSTVPSPTSDLSRLDASPPAPQTSLVPNLLSPPQPPADPRTKKELWRDLKVQSITRAIATAYLVPLIYLLTSSQLTILARTRYLADVKAAHAAREAELRQREFARPRGWLSYFSVDSMGLGEYVERGTAVGASLIPDAVRSLFWSTKPTAVIETPEALAAREMQLEEERAIAERLFLTYSWWLLHEGWRSVASRIETAVERVFAGVPLKREITPDVWDSLVREVRASVETDVGSDGSARLYDFTPLIVPPVPRPPTFEECPLPIEPEGAHLIGLLQQTKEHVSGPDARILVDRGTSAMLGALADTLRADTADGRPHHRRMADCLPELNRWSKSVWEGVPDGGVETLLAIPEYEAFAALVFGDWAPRE